MCGQCPLVSKLPPPACSAISNAMVVDHKYKAVLLCFLLVAARRRPSKKSCHSIVIRMYDLRMTIFMIVIAEVIRTYDIAMTDSAIVDWSGMTLRMT